MDQYINDTGVTIDIDAVKKAKVLVVEETKRLNDELFRLTGGAINAGTQRDAIKAYLEKKGVKLPNLTKATVKEALAKTGGDNLRVLQLRQQLSLTSNAKYQALLDAVSEDHRVRDLLIYHGAGTGRWAGKLFQIHNLVKAILKLSQIDEAINTLKTSPDGFTLCYDVLPTLSSCIRGMFIPSEGAEMFISDFAAIEARVVMWLAGEEKGVKLFCEQDEDPTKADIYVHMARSIFGKSTLTKADKKARQLGKQAVLGCGYGMGVTKFIDTCHKYEVEVTEQLAERAVYQYRNVFGKVPRFWYSMEAAAKQTVVSGKPHQCGKILWYMDGEFLRMKLPIGRTIVYHRPKVDTEGKLTFMATNNITKKYGVEETWGGKLVENCTQAVARDLMVEAMFRLMKTGYRILFTVHDELVLEKVDGRVEEVIKLMRQVPTWANGCPINAECEQTERYQK
jgi:DNA polymerase